ncbi:MAG: GNAT family N-acetyltransferase [Ignavibacteria bacterium]|nr:GNAT family N-acetyltransferase [Ignavibacteria bacterium]
MDTNEIILKHADQKDAESISLLINSVYRGENSKKGWTTEADFLTGIRITTEKILEIINKENNIVIMAEYSKNLIGVVHLENSKTFAYLGMLSVDVNFQTKGIAKLLLNKCEQITKNLWKLKEIRMKVINRRTELIEYYKRRGYEQTGKLEKFGSITETFGNSSEQLWFETLIKSL